MQGSSSGKRFGLLSRLVGAGAILFGVALPAHANLTIVPLWDSTITSDANVGTIEATINKDISTIDSYIANSITVNINFAETNTGLAQSNNLIGTIPYSTYLSDVETKQTLSPSDTTALATLGVTGPAGPFATNNPVNGNSSIKGTRPLLAALGERTTGVQNVADCTIVFNAGIVNDSRTGALVLGKYDLQSAIAHELDECLNIGGPGSQLNNVATGSNTASGPVSPLDLYRYSSAGVRSYSTSNTVSSYFSINGGTTTLLHFNQNGAFVPPNGTADNSDFGDWGDGVIPSDGNANNPPHIQDAYGNPYDGTSDTFSNLGPAELTGIDVVGWNLTAAGTAVENSPLPEPSSCGLLAVGAISFLARRRRAM